MKRLVVIADQVGGKDSALRRALDIRKQNAAKITFLGFTYAEVVHPGDLKDAGITMNELRVATRKRRLQELAEVAQNLGAGPGEVSCKVIWSKDVAGETIDHCKKHPADMIIKSAHRSGTWLYTSTDWQLFRQSPTPVMITTNKSWRKKPRVLAAVDLGTSVRSKQRLNDKIIQQAKAVAEVLGDEVHLAYSVKVPQPLVDLDVVNSRKYFAKKKKKLKPTIDAFCKKHHLEPEHIHLKLGSPARIIPSIANSLKADLVVAGTIGRKGVKGKLVGNTAEGILGNLHTDILTLHP